MLRLILLIAAVAISDAHDNEKENKVLRHDEAHYLRHQRRLQGYDYSPQTATPQTRGEPKTERQYNDPWGSSGGSSYGGGTSSDPWDATTDPWDTTSSGEYDGFGGSSSESTQSWRTKLDPIRVNLVIAVLVAGIILSCGMIFTAYQFERNPEGGYANCCRLSINTVEMFYKVAFNLYHCRLGEITDIVSPCDEDDEEYTEEELERMKLRPGMARALEVEHKKALRKTQIELKQIVPPSRKKRSSGGR